MNHLKKVTLERSGDRYDLVLVVPDDQTTSVLPDGYSINLSYTDLYLIKKCLNDFDKG